MDDYKKKIMKKKAVLDLVIRRKCTHSVTPPQYLCEFLMKKIMNELQWWFRVHYLARSYCSKYFYMFKMICKFVSLLGAFHFRLHGIYDMYRF